MSKADYSQATGQKDHGFLSDHRADIAASAYKLKRDVALGARAWCLAEIDGGVYMPGGVYLMCSYQPRGWKVNPLARVDLENRTLYIYDKLLKCEIPIQVDEIFPRLTNYH